ncbi:MAG: pyridoxal-phosphate dependent enzyme [Dehalococcoidia bacterium]|nr:pyridoxal-phosphate dependent enzyme [Dehalococcoidia bacterium]
MRHSKMRQSEERGSPDHSLRVYSDITQLIAGPENPTPLVRLNRINTSTRFKIYLKLERYNPFGSIKDRIALAMLDSLEPGSRTVIEPSSGNTGIALTCLANARGTRIEIAIPEKVPDEKKVMLRFLGAGLREADDSLCPLFPTEGARGLVRAMLESPATRDEYVSPNQYENELNLLAHYRMTGPEIWRQTGGAIGLFFAGFGTCGTITGIGRYLKEQNPAIRVVGVEPASKEHKLPGMKRISGLDKEFVPGILDRSVIDDVVDVTDEQAYGTAIDLARKEGIPVGPTTGAILHAALEYARSSSGLAVVISPDDAFKYASFYREVLEKEAAVPAESTHDLSGLICPLSKIRATALVDDLMEGETASIILGDVDSLKSVAQELKARGLRAGFRRENEARFVITVTRPPRGPTA